MESVEGVLEAPVSSSSSAVVTGPDGAMYLVRVLVMHRVVPV